MPAHEHVSSHHAAHAQDADHDADEMHSLVPDQQEEPGEQNHHRDHKTVQELLGALKERTAKGSGMLGHRKKSPTLSESPSLNSVRSRQSRSSESSLSPRHKVALCLT